MPKENLPDLFIRSLTEALEADRFIKRTMRSLQSEQRTERFMELNWADLSSAMLTLDPMDRPQPSMTAASHDLRIN